MAGTDEVITIANNGQVFTFRDYQHARVTLLKNYWPLIITDAMVLASRYDVSGLRRLITRTLGLDKNEKSVETVYKIKDRKILAQKLWPMLVTHGRRTIDMAFGKASPDPSRPGFITYRSNFVPGEDDVRDISYLSLPPQARVIVDMIVNKILPMGDGGVPEHVFIKCLNECEEDLKTRQRPWAIFNYYRKTLVTRGFIIIDKPREWRKR